MSTSRAPAPHLTGEVYVYNPTSPALCECVFSGAELVAEVHARLRAGRPVACLPFDTILSVPAAADFLNLPLDATRKLVADGIVPDAGHGVRVGDLYEYRRVLAAERQAARTELDRVQAALGFED